MKFVASKDSHEFHENDDCGLDIDTVLLVDTSHQLGLSRILIAAGVYRFATRQHLIGVESPAVASMQAEVNRITETMQGIRILSPARKAACSGYSALTIYRGPVPNPPLSGEPWQLGALP